MPKTRLDILLTEKGLCESRKRAQALIMTGKVFVDGKRIVKPGASINVDADVEIKAEKKAPFASRAGEKLDGAIKHFNINPKGKMCLDIGASTGGFTDCLLQKRATGVYAVDVGYGQLVDKLRTDKRVTVRDRVNARYIKPDDFDVRFDLCVIDVSFISLTLIFPVLPSLLKRPAELVALIKPQFEAGKEKVGKGGIVKDEKTHDECIDKIKAALEEQGFNVIGVVKSSVVGTKGNQEFLVYARIVTENISKMICENNIDNDNSENA